MALNTCLNFIITGFFLSIKYLIDHPLNFVLILIGALIILSIAKSSQTPMILGFLAAFIDGIGILEFPEVITPFLMAITFGLMGLQTKINPILKFFLVPFLMFLGFLIDIISIIPAAEIITVPIDLIIGLLLSSSIIATILAIFSVFFILASILLSPLFWIFKSIGFDWVCSTGNLILDKLFLSISLIKWKRVR